MTLSRPAARPGAPGPADASLEVMGLFDAKAADWPGKYWPDGPLSGRLTLLSAAVGRHAKVGHRVLDLGCGTGELALRLADAGLQVTGCDISPNMLQHAAARDGAGRPAWVRLTPDWRRLPFKPATFDLVVAASVLEYVTEPGTVLRECARILRPGGVVLYTVPDPRHPVRWAEWGARQLAALAGPPSGPGRRTSWDRYRAYLRTSRQRHRLRWWLAASDAAGLDPLPSPVPGTRSALRLLAFARAGENAGEIGGPPHRQAGHR